MPSSIAPSVSGNDAEGMDEPYRGAPALRARPRPARLRPVRAARRGHALPAAGDLPVLGRRVGPLARGRRADETPRCGAAAGHSLGEYAALVAAGALAFDDAVGLVAERAAAMADAGDAAPPARMIAMLGGDDHARPRARRPPRARPSPTTTRPASSCSPATSTRSPRAEELARDETGARARRLDVTGAFHSPLMQPAAARLARRARRHARQRAAFPVYSNGSAAPFMDVRGELSENLLRPVRWRETLLALRAAGVDRFVELGPGAVLTGLVKRTLAAA